MSVWTFEAEILGGNIIDQITLKIITKKDKKTPAAIHKELNSSKKI